MRLIGSLEVYILDFGRFNPFSGPRTLKIELLGSKTSSYMPTTSILVAGELKTFKFINKNTKYFYVCLLLIVIVIKYNQNHDKSALGT